METKSIKKQIAVFASGNGSNAENITRYFRESDSGAEVGVIICNNPGAGVLGRAGRLGVPAVVMSKAEINDEARMLAVLERYDADLIVLAGFLLKIPEFMIRRYPDRIVNIHPALLPKYGGKGMYGHHVHEAVVAAGEPETGITIHYVNENYDDGSIIFQAKTSVVPGDTPDDVAGKIHILEQRYFPEVLAKTFYSK